MASRRNLKPENRPTFETLEPRLLLSGSPILPLGTTDPVGGLPGTAESLAADSYEPDNTAATAKAITVGAPAQVHSFDVGGDVDWVTFTLAAPTTIVMQTTGASLTGDTEITLYGPNSTTTFVGTNDDGGNNGYYSKLTLPLAAGQYYLKVDDFWGAVLDSYSLSVTAIAPDSFEADNTGAAAKTITTNGVAQTHTIDTYTDIDWMKFTLAGYSNVTASITSALSDMSLDLYGPNSYADPSAIGHVDAFFSSGAPGQIIMTGTEALAPGTYYLKAAGYWTDQLVSNYTVSVTASSATPAIQLTTPFTSEFVAQSVALAWTDFNEPNATAVSFYIDTDNNTTNGIGQTLLGTWNQNAGVAGGSAEVTLPASIVPKTVPYYIWGTMTDTNGTYTTQVVPIQVFDRAYTVTDVVGDADGGDEFEVYGLDVGFLGSTLYWQVRSGYDPQDAAGGGDLYINVGGTYEAANGSVSAIAVNPHSVSSGADVVAGDLYTGATFLGGTLYPAIPVFINTYSAHVTGASTSTITSVTNELWAYQIAGTLLPSALPGYTNQTIQLAWTMYCGNDVVEILLQNPPVVNSVTINGGSAQRSDIESIALNFSENVTVTAGALTLHNNTTGLDADLSAAVVSGSGTSTVTWDLDAVDLADGNYTATLLAGHVTDSAGMNLDGDGDGATGDNYNFNFFRKWCDSTGDALVNGNDLAVWQRNYDPLKQHVNDASMADWNGDGYINGNDLALWQQRYDPLGSFSINQLDQVPEVLSFSQTLAVDTPQVTSMPFDLAIASTESLGATTDSSIELAAPVLGADPVSTAATLAAPVAPAVDLLAASPVASVSPSLQEEFARPTHSFTFAGASSLLDSTTPDVSSPNPFVLAGNAGDVHRVAAGRFAVSHSHTASLRNIVSDDMVDVLDLTPLRARIRA